MYVLGVNLHLLVQPFGTGDFFLIVQVVQSAIFGGDVPVSYTHLANDGLTPYYNQKQLEGYKNSKGANDLLYPNVDLYDQLLNKNANYRKASFDMTGGTDRVRNTLIAEYVGGSGFEDVTDVYKRQEFTLEKLIVGNVVWN